MCVCDTIYVNQFCPSEAGGIVGNVNILTGLLSVDKIKSITNGTDCGLLGEYLAWDPSKWETTKDYVRYLNFRQRIYASILEVAD